VRGPCHSVFIPRHGACGALFRDGGPRVSPNVSLAIPEKEDVRIKWWTVERDDEGRVELETIQVHKATYLLLVTVDACAFFCSLGLF
jgi:hypothetical protein